jgi:hypothetical protein
MMPLQQMIPLPLLQMIPLPLPQMMPLQQMILKPLKIPKVMHLQMQQPQQMIQHLKMVKQLLTLILNQQQIPNFYTFG